MPRRNATYETSLTVRLLGLHEVTAHMVADHLQVLMPGAAITVTDKRALTAVYRAWIEAHATAEKAFTGDRCAVKLFQQPAQRVVGAVLISGRQPGPTILGKAPETSPSGCGQLLWRLGRLTIVCDDRAAWQSQYAGWLLAAEIAAAHWGGIALPAVAAAARRRGRARLVE